MNTYFFFDWQRRPLRKKSVCFCAFLLHVVSQISVDLQPVFKVFDSRVFFGKNRTKRRIEDHSTEYCLANRILEEMWLFLDDAEFMKKYFSKHPFVFHTKKKQKWYSFWGDFYLFLLSILQRSKPKASQHSIALLHM